MSEKKVVTVLSIDGGGIRGIVPAAILAEIEKLTTIKVRSQVNNVKNHHERRLLASKLLRWTKGIDGTEYIPTAKLFDMIAGTSTGGIVALALAQPNEQNRPKYTAGDLGMFYVEEGPRIFHRPLWQRMPLVGGAVSWIANWGRAKYSTDRFKKIVTEYFRKSDRDATQNKLSEALCDVIVPSYEIKSRRPWFFKSTKAKKKKRHDFLMADVALATSAAPTYFRPHKIKSLTMADGKVYEGKFVDGGLYANHPAMCAFVEARIQYPGTQVILVSLGTGERDPFQDLNKKKGTWGQIAWLIKQRIINIIFDGASDTVRYQLEALLREPEDGRLYRFQFQLSEDNKGLDKADVRSLRTLIYEANNLIKTQEQQLNELCDELGKELFNKLRKEVMQRNA